MKCLRSLLLLCVFAYFSALEASYIDTHYFYDGGNHVINDDTYINDRLVVGVNDNELGPATTLQFLTGGVTNVLTSSGSSTLIIDGGTASDAIAARDSVMYFYSGSLPVGISVGSRSTMHMYGGVTSGIHATDQSVVHLYGGTFTSLLATVESTVNIYGYNFNLPLGTVSDLDGTITGYLSDGTSLNAPFERYFGGWAGNGTINLINKVPDSESTAALLGAGVAALAFARRRLG